MKRNVINETEVYTYPPKRDYLGYIANLIIVFLFLGFLAGPLLVSIF